MAELQMQESTLFLINTIDTICSIFRNSFVWEIMNVNGRVTGNLI